MAHPLRELLPRTYQAYLGRFERPNEVQERAIPPILARRDTLLCAPTASGKTEAYAAPAAEILLASPRHPLSLLVVSPTRALANDLKRRLEGRMDALGITFGRYTGEHKERAGANFPEAVVTTPEGLDSLLARRVSLLGHVHTIVLDEIHVLDNTPRGDQLRVLLHRLERAAGSRPQRIAASATVGDPDEMAGRYLTSPAVISISGGRRLAARAFQGAGVDAVCEHLRTLAGAGFRKILVFCNSRRDVEHFATGIRGRTPFQDRVFPHHGSLSRIVRERTERHFLEAPAGIAVSTMTLELGIDIGTVDYVLLTRPPASVSSLIQRVGRGGRRRRLTRVGYACRDAGEEVLFRVMIECGVRGELHEVPYSFRPGVLVQQALCLAGSRGHVTPRALAAATPPALRATSGEGFARSILDAMNEKNLLETPRGGRYVLVEGIERRYDRGSLHSNFSDPADVQLVDRLTGDVIGRIDGAVMRGGKIKLGGEGRQAVVQIGERILTDRRGGGEPASYASGYAPQTSLGLGRAVARALGAEGAELVQVPLGSTWCLLHGLGTLGGLLLAEVIARRGSGGTVGQPTPFTLRLARPLDSPPAPTEDEVAGFLRRHEARLLRLCGMGLYHVDLPPDVQTRALREAAALQPVVELLDRAKLKSLVPGDEPPPALALL